MGGVAGEGEAAVAGGLGSRVEEQGVQQRCAAQQPACVCGNRRVPPPGHHATGCTAILLIPQHKLQHRAALAATLTLSSTRVQCER